MTDIPFSIKLMHSLGLIRVKQNEPRTEKAVSTKMNGCLPQGFAYDQPVKSTNRKKIKLPKIRLEFLVLFAVVTIGVLVVGTGYKDPYVGVSPQKKDLMQNQKSWDDLTKYASEDYVKVMSAQKPTIDSISDCTSLQGIYDRNTGWAIRPYVAHRILELNCVE